MIDFGFGLLTLCVFVCRVVMLTAATAFGEFKGH